MKEKDKFRVLFLVVALLFYFACKPAFLFVLPGVLVLYLPVSKGFDLFESLVYPIFVSLSFWIVGFWALKFIPFSFTSFVFFSILASFGFAFFKGKPKANPSFRKVDILSFFLLFALLWLFYPIYNQQIAPGGADMATQTYVTKIISEKNMFPDNYKPVLPVEGFGSSPFGFSVISVGLSFLANIPAYRATLLLTSLTYPLLAVAIYLFLKRQFSLLISFMATFVVFFLGPEILHYLEWGGNITIFAIALLCATFAFLILISKKRLLATANIFVLALLSFASFTTHHSILIIPLTLVPFIALKILFKTKRENLAEKLIPFMLYFLFLSFFAVPFLASLKIPSEETLEWIKEWHQNYWQGDIHDFLKTIPLFLKQRYAGALFGMGAAGIVASFFIKKKYTFLYFFSLAILFLTILNSRYWVVPFSALFYPDRAVSIFVIPLSFFVACLFVLITKIAEKVFSNKLFAQLILLILLLVFPISGKPIPARLKEYYEYALSVSKSSSSVTKDDIEAFEWISANTTTKDVFENNYSDAGIWVPAVAYRRITTNDAAPYHFDELKEANKNIDPNYLYIGAKQIYETAKYRPHLVEEYGTWELIYQSGEARVYKKKQ